MTYLKVAAQATGELRDTPALPPSREPDNPKTHSNRTGQPTPCTGACDLGLRFKPKL